MKISRPTRPKAVVLTCYRCFLRARVRPFRADAGRERNQDAPQEGACIPAMRPKKSAQEGTLQQGSLALKFSTASLLHALQRCCQPFEMLERSVWFGARGARKLSSRTFLGCCFGSGAAGPYIFTRPTRPKPHTALQHFKRLATALERVQQRCR